MLTILNNRFSVLPNTCPVPSFEFRQTPNVSPSKSIVPSLIVIHYTASDSFSGTIAHCCSPASKVSYHLIIDRDGSVCQLANFAQRAWHAGMGHWNGITDINSHSVGIGLINWGLLLPNADGRMFAWPQQYTQPITSNHSYVARAHKHTPHKTQYWDTYPAAQLASLKYVVNLLVNEYPIYCAVGHDDVAPGRKVDPGPACIQLPCSAFPFE